MGLILIIIVIVAVCWSEAKKAWAEEEAKKINARRKPFDPHSHWYK